MAPVAFRKPLEEGAAPLAHARQLAAQRGRIDLQHAQGGFGVARKLLEPVAGKLAAEIVAGHVLDFVRLVEHHRGILRQDRAEVVLADG